MKTKYHMTILNEPPPYMPLDEESRLIWIIIQYFGYYNVNILEYEPKKKIVFSAMYGTSKVKRELDLSWAFGEDIDPLPLVRKVFKDMEEKKYGE